ncbi:MAG: hypothetical protein H7141_10030 [Burkholderiales bacterium]|nr:hypothetical protein [Bacteroidia bacterium]
MTCVKLALICFLFSLVGQAQDTLFLKDKQKLIVQVKEVSQTEIQFKKMDLLDGPMYITSKNDVEKIIYKNGYTEVIKSEVPPVNQQSFTVYNNVVDINTEKINYADTKKRYGSFVSLIDRHPDPSRRDQLMRSANEIRGLKRHQDGTRTGAIIFGGVAIGGALLYSAVSSLSYQSNVDPIFAGPPVIFGALGLALGAASIAINVNLRKKRHEFVNLYNQ